MKAGLYASRAQRHDRDDRLDFYPTPPWATRALCEHLEEWGGIARDSCWEPACGEGHMVRPLKEYFASVHASDIHDYSAVFPGQDRVSDFLLPRSEPPHIRRHRVDWIITNPPFRLAEPFALRTFEIAHEGVALLVRTSFLEGVGRHERLFRPHPPEWILQFTERVPIHRGRLDKDGSTATAYCWLIWTMPTPGVTDRNPRHHSHFPALKWLPPCRARLEKPEDYPPGGPAPVPLLEGLDT